MGLFDSLFGNKREPPSAHNSAGPIVLVVRRASEALTRGLRIKGRLVLSFPHGEPELADRVAGCAPACVVVEVESESTNGFAVANAFKRDGRLQSVPLVLFSSDTDQETFDQHARLRTRASAYVASSDPERIRVAVLPLVSSSPMG